MKRPIDYKREVFIEDGEESGRRNPIYRAVIKGDDRGFYKKSVLYANGDSWTLAVKDKPLVTIEDHDCEFSVTIHKPGKEPIKFNLSVSDFADMRALMEAIHRTERLRYFSPLRIAKGTEKRRITKK